MEQFQALAPKRVLNEVYREAANFAELSPLPAIVADSELTVIEANEAANDLFKTSDLRGRSLGDFVVSANDLRDAIGGVGRVEIEFTFGNETISCEVFAKNQLAGGWLLLINDISERRQAERTQLASEKQKWKIQRTEALERLAGGIAHEFNNYLAVILLQTDMVNLQLPDDGPLAGRVGEIKAVANDAASVVRQLLAFGRRQSMNPSPTVLNSLFKSAERDLRALTGGSVSLEFDLSDDLGVCFVDTSQIVQAMMYLTLNALERMSGGGTIQFRTSNIAKGGPRIHHTQTSGSYIQIEVSDTGTQIETRSADHVFEPFFSTKGSKENSGLALATVWGIVKQSGGYIWVKNRQGEGTTFSIQFPRIDEPKTINVAASNERGATILLIDDEMSVRRVAAEALRGAGYRVIEASSGEEAVEIARNFPGTFQLILTDYVMPAMDGVEACEKILSLHTGAKRLFISGDPSSIPHTNQSLVLAKPFSISQLVERVSKSLKA